jgi:hypothetical protein
MNRDIGFAQKISGNAEKLGFMTIKVDGSKTIDQNYEFVKNQFKLK